MNSPTANPWEPQGNPTPQGQAGATCSSSNNFPGFVEETDAQSQPCSCTLQLRAKKGSLSVEKSWKKDVKKTRKRWKLMETYGVNRNKHIGVQYVKDRESCVYIQQNLLQGTAQYASSVQCHAIFWIIFSHIKPNMQDCNNGVCCACVTPGIFTADQRCFPAMETYG